MLLQGSESSGCLFRNVLSTSEGTGVGSKERDE
jgi:hypothetical protein